MKDNIIDMSSHRVVKETDSDPTETLSQILGDATATVESFDDDFIQALTAHLGEMVIKVLKEEGFDIRQNPETIKNHFVIMDNIYALMHRIMGTTDLKEMQVFNGIADGLYSHINPQESLDAYLGNIEPFED